MSNPIKNLSNQQLFTILECKNRKALNNKFSAKKVHDLLAEVTETESIKIEKNKYTQSFMSFSDGPNYPFLALWGTLEVVSISIIPLTIITIFTSLLVLGLGGIYFYATYYDILRKAEKIRAFFQFAFLQQLCADLLLERLKTEYEKKLHECHVPIRKQWQVKPQPHPQNEEILIDKNRLPRLRDAISTSLVVSTALVGTYYFGTSTIITAYGLSTVATAMLGPLGLAVAFVVAMGLGAYFGYKHYQATRNQKMIKQQQKAISNSIEQKLEECYALKDKIEHLPNFKKRAYANRPKNQPEVEKTRLVRKVNSTYRFSYFPMLLVNQKHKIPQVRTKRFPAKQTSRRPGMC